MKPQDVVEAVTARAGQHDLVVGPVVHDEAYVRIYLSAAHESSRTAIFETNGVELFSLLLDDFALREFEHEDQDQPRLVGELVDLAATYLFGGGDLSRTTGRFRRSRRVLTVHWQGEARTLTAPGGASSRHDG